jgi:hypothetical protein
MKELRTRAILLDAWLREAFTKRQHWHRRHLAATLLFFAEGVDAQDSGFSEHHQIRDGSLLSDQQDSDDESCPATPFNNNYNNNNDSTSSSSYTNDNGYNNNNNSGFGANNRVPEGWIIGPSGQWEEVQPGRFQPGTDHHAVNVFGVHEASRSKTPTRVDEVILNDNTDHNNGNNTHPPYPRSNSPTTMMPSRSVSPPRIRHEASIRFEKQNHRNSKDMVRSKSATRPLTSSSSSSSASSSRKYHGGNMPPTHSTNVLVTNTRSASAARSMANTFASTNHMPPVSPTGASSAIPHEASFHIPPREYSSSSGGGGGGDGGDLYDEEYYDNDDENDQLASSMRPGRGLRSLRTSRSCSPASRNVGQNSSSSSSSNELKSPPMTPRDASLSSNSTVGSDNGLVYGQDAISALDGNSDEENDDDEDFKHNHHHHQQHPVVVTGSNKQKDKHNRKFDESFDDIGFVADDYDDEDEEEEEDVNSASNDQHYAPEHEEEEEEEEVMRPVLSLKLKSTVMGPDGVPMKRRARRLTPSAAAHAKGALKKSPALQRHILLFTGTDREAVHASHGQSWGVPEDVSRFTRCV